MEIIFFVTTQKDETGKGDNESENKNSFINQIYNQICRHNSLKTKTRNYSESNNRKVQFTNDTCTTAQL